MVVKTVGNNISHLAVLQVDQANRDARTTKVLEPPSQHREGRRHSFPSLKNVQTTTYIHDEIWSQSGIELMHKNAELVVLTDRLRQPLLEDLGGR